MINPTKVVVELKYRDGTTRNVEMHIEEEMVMSGTPNKWYPGVVANDQDFEAQCAEYGINEGRALECIYASVSSDDNFLSWKVVEGEVELMRLGIVDFTDAERERRRNAYRELVREIGIGFHPDTCGNDYSPPLADPERYNQIVDDAFLVCDPYQIAIEVFEKEGWTK